MAGLTNYPFFLTLVQDPAAFEREYAAAVVPSATTLVVNPPAVGSDDEPVKEFTPVGKGGKAMQFTSEGIFKNLQAVQEARGKKVCSIHFAIHCHNLQMPRIRTEPNKSGFLKTP